MHEFSMMERVLKTVLLEAEKHGAVQVLEVVLEVGELTHLNTDQLIFAFQVLSDGTIAEKAKLTVDRIPPRIECPQCGYLGPVSLGVPEVPLGYGTFFLKCDSCGNRDLRILSGKECKIKNLKIKISPLRSEREGESSRD